MDVKVSAEELEFVAHRLFPQEWRRLGRKLLTTIDPHFPNVEGILGNLEFKHQDEGVRRIVLQTMLRWQSMWGDRATVALLVRALEDLELTGIADGLREMVAARNDPTVQRSGHSGIKSKEDGDPIIQICREALKNHYTAMYESTFPLRWRDFGINVQTTYIPVQVIRLDRGPSEKLSPQPDVEVSLDQKTMMFQGPAGAGKSLLCYKMACDWVAGKDSRLKDIQLLFVLSAMSIGTGDILDAVYDQIFPVGFVEKVPKSKLERWIKANTSSVMFIIDDVDAVQETGSSLDVDKNPVLSYIHGNYLRNTRSILTCRSSAMIDCYSPAQTTATLPRCDAHFLINGFSEGGVDELVCRFFSGSEDSRAMGRRLKEAIRSIDHLSDMVQNPLYAFMVCSLWQRGKAPPINLAQLIEEFIVLISDQYCTKTPSMSKESVQTTLDKVANLAWSLREVGSNTLTYEDIQDAVGNDIGFHIGFLVHVKSARREDHYRFVQRVFCEYFAAKFISTPSTAGDHAKHLQTCWSTGCISGNKYGNVCLFAAGLLKEKSRDLFAAFNTNLSDMITQGSSLCCLNTAISQACRAITESGHPNLTAPLVAKALPKELILDFRGKPPPRSVLHGLAALITTKHFPNTLSLRNLWVTKSSTLLHLGEAIKNSKRLSTLRVDVTGMDMTLSNPERTDNSGIVAFHRCVAENRGITCLQVNADLNAMDGKAVAAIPEVMERKTDLLVLELIITASTSCSTRCGNLVTKGYKTGCKREKNIQVFNETFADTLGRNKTLQSLCMSGHLLKHKSALELVAPAIASHPRISSFRVSGLPGDENYTHGCEIEALAHILLKSKTLKSFSLSLPSLVGDTHDRDVSAQQSVNILCAALKQCRTLEKLELTFTYLFAKEKLLLADVIKSGRSLKEVSLSWRNMNEAFLVAFSRAIRAKPARSVQEITLSGAFDSRGLVRLGKAVVNSQSLVNVTLQHSKFDDKGLEEFVDEVMEAVASFPEERDVPLHITLQGAVDGECADDAISTAELLSMELQDSDYANLTVHLEPDNPKSPAFHAPVKKSSDFTFIVDFEKGDTPGSQQEQALRWLTRR